MSMSTSEILLDTSALIAFLQGRGIGEEVQVVLAERRGVISAVSVYELCAGVRSKTHLDQRLHLISLTRVVAMDQTIAHRAADLFTTLRSGGVTIDNEDLIVAATAIERGVAVLTENTRHFAAIPELRLVIPGHI